MSDALILTCEAAAFAFAATLVVYAIVKLDERPMLAGAALAALAWLMAGCLSQPPEPYQRLGLITLRLQPLDAVTDESVSGAIVAVIAPGETGELVAWRLPVKPDAVDRGILTVPLFVQREIHGSPWEQFRRSAECVRTADQQIEISAPGYRPWRGSLTELLPEGGREAADEAAIVINLWRTSEEERNN